MMWQRLSSLNRSKLFRVSWLSLLVLLALGVVLLAPCWYLRNVFWLDAHGRTADGIVVDGEMGTTADNTIYCEEKIEFRDDHGALRKTTRSCGTKPETGARVTVRYAPDDPDHIYVDGDNRVGEVILLIIVFGGVAVWLITAIVASEWNSHHESR
jgi:hypothetical protein